MRSERPGLLVPLVLLVVASLVACKRDRESLGSFVEDRAMTLADHCAIEHDTAIDGPVLRCTMVFDGVNCPCEGTATLFQADDHKNVRLIQLQIDHCPHEVAAQTIVEHLEWLLRKEDRARLEHDIGSPGHDAVPPTLHPINGTISTRQVYGDRTVELEWSRDAYRQPDGSVVDQSREWYFVAIRPRSNDDKPQVSVSKDRHVTEAPRAASPEEARRPAGEEARECEMVRQ